MDTTISVKDDVGFKTGDIISVSTADNRWWKRLLHFVTLRSGPTFIEQYRVGAVSNNTAKVQAISFGEFNGRQ